MTIISEITEKECVKESYHHSTAKIRLVQHCLAISATAELLLNYAIMSRVKRRVKRIIIRM